METRRALLIVDVQRDFCEDGALAVKGGNEVAHKIASYVKDSGQDYNYFILSRDTHNPLPDTNCGHFSEQPDYIDSWPVHCVKGSEGWKLHPEIESIMAWVDMEVEKGQGVPAYSAFEGSIAVTNHCGNFRGATLGSVLRGVNVTELDVCGLAYDHCVKASADDAFDIIFKVRVLKNLTASVSAQGEEDTDILFRSIGIDVVEV